MNLQEIHIKLDYDKNINKFVCTLEEYKDERGNVYKPNKVIAYSKTARGLDSNVWAFFDKHKTSYKWIGTRKTQEYKRSIGTLKTCPISGTELEVTNSCRSLCD